MTVPTYPETAAGLCNQQGAGPACGCTAARAVRRRRRIARSCSTSSTTDTCSWGSTTVEARGTGRPSTRRTTRNTVTSRCGTVSTRRNTCNRSDYVDPNRIGIIGGSYGGYMVLAALAFQPNEFVAGVDLFGVGNWIRTLESIPSWWEAQRTALYQELWRSSKGPRATRRGIAAPARRSHPQAAAGPARGQRSPGAEGGIPTRSSPR